MPTALITGATGLLGRAVFDAFARRGEDWIAIGTGLTRAEPPRYRKLDLLDEKALEGLLGEVKPQVVVHCAANRSPESCASNPALARSLNVTSTAHLSRLCSRHRILLLYISTDYVFPGPPGADLPYTSSSTPSPTNLYGETKLDGEKAVLVVENDDGGEVFGGLVLRVPVLYGRCSPRNNYAESAVNILVDAVYKAQEPSSKAPSGKIVTDDWAQRYPTSTEDVARVCVDISVKYLNAQPSERKAWPRILHFTSEERMTKYQMCEVFAEILGLPLEGIVANKEGNDPKAKVQRPYDTHLGTEELKSVGVDVSCVSFGDWWRRELGAYRK